MGTVARLQDNGDFLINGEIDERSPAITNGLVHHFPFDDTSGAFDRQGGVQTIQNVESGTNLIDAMKTDWKNPKNWYVTSGSLNNISWDEEKEALRIQGNNYLWLNSPIIVDTTKTYWIEAEVLQENDEDNGSGNYNRLYLGGHGFTKDGVKYTSNYDYSMSSNYDLPLDTWVRLGVVRNGTGSVVSTTRVLTGSENPSYVQGWNSTNGTCHRFHFGGLFNYYGGSNSVMYIKNISIKIVDEDNSNTTLTPDGIGIGEATTNLVANPIDPTTWSLSADPTYGFISSDIIDTEFGVKGLRRVTKTSGNDYRSCLTQIPYDTSTVGASTTVTKAIYARTMTYTGNEYMNLNFQGADATGTRKDYTLTFQITNEWKRFDITMLLSDYGMTSIIGAMKVYTYGTDNLEKTIDIACPQLEIKPYATTFVVGSRSSSLVELNIPRLTTYTIFGKFLPYSPLENGSSYTTTANSSSLIRIEDTLKTGGAHLRFYLSGSNSSPYFDPDGYYNTSGGSGHIHKNYEIDKLAPVYFAIRKSGTSSKIKLFQNGWKSEHEMVVPSDAGVDAIKFGGTTIWNGLFSDLSVYNRTLSDLELDKLIGNTLSIVNDGNMTNQIKEDESEWKLVWQGLATHIMYNVNSEHEVVNVYGDDVQFNQMKITCPHWSYEVQANTTETAVLKNKLNYYAQWLETQPDSPSPRIKFHGIDNIQDVGFTNETIMFFGYGNSWRRVTPVHYVDGVESMYHGSVPSYIKYSEWYTGTGDDRYQGGMARDTDRESGRYSLTPREYQTIQVWVRMNPSLDESKKMRNKDGKVVIKGQLIEDVDLSQ